MKNVHEHITFRTHPPKEIVLILASVLFFICLSTVSFAADLTAEQKEQLEQKLFSAVWSNQPSLVAGIIEAGIDPNTKVPLKNNAYRTLLYDATYKGFGEVVKVLLDKRADANAQNSNGKTALHLAAQRGSTEIVGLLLNAKADPNPRAEDGSTPLTNASFDGHVDVADLLIKAGADVNAQTERTGRTALHIASKNGHTEFARFLLEHGALPNVQDEEQRTALGLAAMNGNTKTVELLLSYNANPNAGERPSLLYAAQGGHEEIVRQLLEHHADINRTESDGRTALMEAVRGGHVDTERLLLKHGADPSLSDSLGLTALHEASDGATAELLLLYHASVDSQDKEGNTPLYLTARRAGNVQCLKCEEKVEVLVKFRANLLAVNNGGDGIIHAASEGGLQWLVEQCLKADADINAKDNMGRTPLHLAVSLQRPSLEFIKYLIDKGADVNAIDNGGQTPLDLATELPPVRGQDIIEVLVAHGAQSSMTLKPPP